MTKVSARRSALAHGCGGHPARLPGGAPTGAIEEGHPMTARKLLLPALAILLLGAVALGLWGHARDRAQARAVWQAPDAARESDPPL